MNEHLRDGIEGVILVIISVIVNIMFFAWFYGLILKFI